MKKFVIFVTLFNVLFFFTDIVAYSRSNDLTEKEVVETTPQEPTLLQMCDYLVTYISTEVNGVIQLKKVDEKSGANVVQINLPDYYDLTLVVTKINSIVSEYSDISVFKAWHQNEYGYATYLAVGDNKKHYFIVQYVVNHNVLFLGY